jgi:hypothetical protein
MAACCNSQTVILLYGCMLQQSNGHIVIWLHAETDSCHIVIWLNAATVKRSDCYMAACCHSHTVILLYGCMLQQIDVILLYGCMLQQSNGHIVIWLNCGTVKRSYCYMDACCNSQTVILLYGCMLHQSNGHIVIWL